MKLFGPFGVGKVSTAAEDDAALLKFMCCRVPSMPVDGSLPVLELDALKSPLLEFVGGESYLFDLRFLTIDNGFRVLISENSAGSTIFEISTVLIPVVSF